MARKTYLAVDLGASSGRVLCGLFDGKKLSLEEAHRFPNLPFPLMGSYHWNALGLLGEVKTGLRKAAATHGASVVSLGLDTWGVDYGYVDKRGRLLGNPYAYRDPRTSGMEKEACRRAGRWTIYKTTGIQFMFFNTLMQVLADVEHDNPALKSADRLLFMPDLLNYWLTGVMVNEHTIASTSQMIDPRTGRWAKPLLSRLGIPTQMLGKIVEPGTALGRLLPELREEVGLGSARVIAPGCHDTASAVAAVPARGANHAYLSSGTWSLMGVESAVPVITEKGMKYSLTNEGGVEHTIRLLTNICGLWLVQECKRVWESRGRSYDYVELASLAQKEKPFSAFIEPDDPAYATPGDMPARIAAYCRKTRQKAPSTPGAFVRVIYDSLALKYRVVFDRLQELTGRHLDTLHVVGGGAQNKVLNPFAANALNRPVVTGPVEATAIGNILVQMMACGDLTSLEQGRELVRRSFPTVTYEPREQIRWADALARFHAVTGTK
jgi:rhamnulokinase